jgi:ectoine hydroxylase-related dioxygenase (phytanoyl-CoA dioxygenase family)
MTTPIDAILLPTPEEIVRYRACGYYISKPLFTDAELDRAIEASERYYATLDQQQIALPNQKTYTLAWWKGTGADKLRKNDFSTLVVPELDALLRKPVLGAIGALLAGEDVRLWHDQLLYKPPSTVQAPQSVGWHTDHGYWKTCSSDQLLTAWVPFTAMNEEIGTIAFVEGSNHWPHNDHLNYFSSDLEGLERQFNTGGHPVVKTPAILARGQVTFHHCRTIHGSGPNLTPSPRRSLALHLQPASNRYRRYYFNGRLWRHPNDDLTCKPDGQPDYADPTYCPVVGRYGEVAGLKVG